VSPREIQISFEGNQAYECGAKLLALVACPGAGVQKERLDDLESSLCSWALWSRHLANPDDDLRVPVRLRHVFQDARTVERNVKFLAKRLGERLVASRMATPRLQWEESGAPPRLPASIKRLSINRMAEFVLEDAEQRDASNVKRRLWTPSRPVIHLAVAMAVIGQELRRKGLQFGLEHLLLLREFIEEVLRRAELFETLIARSSKFPVRTAELVRVRVV